MTELLRNAGIGWQGLTGDGKSVALLLAVLLFLWLGKKDRKQRAFLNYTTVTTVCCILPWTAVLLMIYQTKFYDYEWIWSMVPLTAMTAYGLTLFLADSWEEFKGKAWRRGVPVTALLLAAAVLSGNPGRQVWNGAEQAGERQRAEAVTGEVRRNLPEEEICLWAPREIMEYVRETDAGILLPYGRNMWNIHLNAYAYDTYDEETMLLYRWMEHLRQSGKADMWLRLAEQDSGEMSWEVILQLDDPFGMGLSGQEGVQRTVTLEESAESALKSGINCILIPQDVEEDVLPRLEEALGAEAKTLEGWYLFLIPAGNEQS